MILPLFAEATELLSSLRRRRRRPAFRPDAHAPPGAQGIEIPADEAALVFEGMRLLMKCQQETQAQPAVGPHPL